MHQNTICLKKKFAVFHVALLCRSKTRLNINYEIRCRRFASRVVWRLKTWFLEKLKKPQIWSGTQLTAQSPHQKSMCHTSCLEIWFNCCSFPNIPWRSLWLVSNTILIPKLFHSGIIHFFLLEPTIFTRRRNTYYVKLLGIKRGFIKAKKV